MKKIVVTGGNGFIGRHFINYLALNNFEIIKVDKIDWDLKFSKSVEEISKIVGKNVDAVVHLAGRIPRKSEIVSDQNYYENNVNASISLANWALVYKIPIVFLSTACVYQNQNQINIQENAEKVGYNFSEFYGLSKRIAEKIFNFYASKGLKRVIIRPSSIYGQGMDNNQLIMQLVEHSRSNSSDIFNYMGNINDSFNFINIADVCEAMLKVLKNDTVGIFNIANDKCTSIEQLINTINAITKYRKIEVNFGSIDKDKSQLKRFHLCNSKAKKEFSFKNSVTLKQGLSQILNHKSN